MSTTDSHLWPLVPWKSKALSVKAVGWIALAINIVASATFSAFAKNLTEFFSPQSLLLISESISAFFILFSFGALPTIRQLFSIPRRELPPILCIGVTSGFLAPLLWFTGLHFTSAINGTLFSNTEMLFLMLLAAVFLREEFTRVHLSSVLLIVIGVAIISLQGLSAGVVLQRGDLLLLASSFVYGIGDVIFRKYLTRRDPHLLLLARSIIAIMGFFLLSPFLPHPLITDAKAFPLHALPVLLGFALISRFLNTFSFYSSLERLPVMTVSLASNLSVIIAVGFAAWFLAEPIHLYHIIGGAFIVFGALLLEVIGAHPTEKHWRWHLHLRRTERA